MKTKFWGRCIAGLFVTFLWLPAYAGEEAGGSSTQPIAIVSALTFETSKIVKQIEQPDHRKAFGRSFITGKLFNKDVIVGVLGVGLVNAAAGTAYLISHVHPKCIIFCGVAGGIKGKVAPGDVVIGIKNINYGYGIWEKGRYSVMQSLPPLTPFSANDQKNPLFFPDSPFLVRAADRAEKLTHLQPVKYENKIINAHPKIVNGIIASVDAFSDSNNFYEHIEKITKCSALEMEGAAVAQVCYQRKIPFIIIRGISDLANKNALETFQHLKDQAAHNACRLVLEMVKNM